MYKRQRNTKYKIGCLFDVTELGLKITFQLSLVTHTVKRNLNIEIRKQTRGRRYRQSAEYNGTADEPNQRATCWWPSETMHHNCIHNFYVLWLLSYIVQVIDLDPGIQHSGCFNQTPAGPTGERTVDCRGGRILRSRVDRRWHVAVSSCTSPVSLDVAYKLVVYGHQGGCPTDQNSAVRRICCDVIVVAIATVSSVVSRGSN